MIPRRSSIVFCVRLVRLQTLVAAAPAAVAAAAAEMGGEEDAGVK